MCRGRLSLGRRGRSRIRVARLDLPNNVDETAVRQEGRSLWWRHALELRTLKGLARILDPWISPHQCRHDNCTSRRRREDQYGQRWAGCEWQCNPSAPRPPQVRGGRGGDLTFQRSEPRSKTFIKVVHGIPLRVRPVRRAYVVITYNTADANYHAETGRSHPVNAVGVGAVVVVRSLFRVRWWDPSLGAAGSRCRRAPSLHRARGGQKPRFAFGQPRTIGRCCPSSTSPSAPSSVSSSAPDGLVESTDQRTSRSSFSAISSGCCSGRRAHPGSGSSTGSSSRRPVGSSRVTEPTGSRSAPARASNAFTEFGYRPNSSYVGIWVGGDATLP